MDFCLLSKFDDLFSDIFLDAQFLWFDTIKLNTDHRRPRIRSDKVLKIIQDKVLPTGKTNEAVKELLRMDYFKHYLATKSAKQQQEFVQHMKRYLYMYMPNAGFEIADTRRYGGAGRRVEACVTVTKDWKTGDEMRLCTGMIAHMEPHQEHELKKGNRDISVMWSTRKQCNCLFLGPARFVNHDCDPNAKFISLGPNSVTFKIIKDISCGDELTAFYGKHYFGENNCECRCATCETKQTGYFASEHDDDDTYSVSTEKEEDTAYRRSSRKRKSALHDHHEAELLYRNKRSSSEIQRLHPIELEELIGVLDKDEHADRDDVDGDHSGYDRYEYNDSPAIKQEQHTDIMTTATTTATAATIPAVKQEMDEGERPKVMSIHFLCNESSKQQQQYRREDSLPRSPSFSHSPLDLLCNAVLDAEYLNVRPKEEDITVVVSSNIHRDATDRVMRMNNQYTALDGQQQQHWRSLDDDDSTSDTKADSAVGLSPDEDTYQQKVTPPPPSATNIIEAHPSSTTKDELSSLSSAQPPQTTTSSASTSIATQWQHGMGSLFDDEQLSDLDDFMDDVSDLSSVCSSDSALESISSSSDETLGHLCTPSPSPVSSDKKKRSPNSNQTQVPRMSSLASLSSSSSTTSTSSLPDTNISKSNGGKSGLDCVACGRTLNSEMVSDPSAADVAVANELATWTWSPSAAFADWRPQRCPRCERHVRVFNQEWPARKIKKSTGLNLTGRTDGNSTLIVPPTKGASNKKRPATKKHSNRKPTSNQYINSFKSTSTGVTRKQYIRSPPTPTSEIFGGVEDLF